MKTERPKQNEYERVAAENLPAKFRCPKCKGNRVQIGVIAEANLTISGEATLYPGRQNTEVSNIEFPASPRLSCPKCGELHSVLKDGQEVPADELPSRMKVTKLAVELAWE